MRRLGLRAYRVGFKAQGAELIDTVKGRGFLATKRSEVSVEEEYYPKPYCTF